MKQKDKPSTEQEKPPCTPIMDVIGKYVMQVLGQPHDLLRVQVRPLWEDCYRVNVLVGLDTTSAKIANSYFLHADRDGNVITCTPRITKQY